MSRFLSLLFLALFSVQLNIPAQQKIMESALIQAEQNGFSGVVLVAEDEKILLEKAMGKRSFEQNIPLQTSDIFELASVSKQFTAMVVMICKEKKCWISMNRWKNTWKSPTKESQSATS